MGSAPFVLAEACVWSGCIVVDGWAVVCFLWPGRVVDRVWKAEVDLPQLGGPHCHPHALVYIVQCSVQCAVERVDDSSHETMIMIMIMIMVMVTMVLESTRSYPTPAPTVASGFAAA